jgi:hypothetical protein
MVLGRKITANKHPHILYNSFLCYGVSVIALSGVTYGHHHLQTLCHVISLSQAKKPETP